MSAAAPSTPPKDSFSAMSCLPEFGDAMVAGKMTLTGEVLRFECDRGSIEWPLAEIELSLGGHNDQHLFLVRRGSPKATLSTSDLALLDHPAFAGHSAVRAQASRTRRQAGRIPRPLIAAGIILLALLAGLVALVVQKDRVIHSLAKKIPMEWEREFGKTIYDQLAKDHKILTNHVAFAAQVRAVTNALLPVIARDGLDYHFYIIEDTNLNAFAVPGGHVFIHTALLSAVKRPEELAGVLAHEIAHVTQRHGFRKLLDTAGLWFAVSAVFGDVEGITAVLVEGSQFLLNQKFSRDFEREADDVGWEYLVAANVNPRGMIDFFATLKKEQEKSPAGQMAEEYNLISTHPATAERMERLEAKWKKLGRRDGFKTLQ